MAKTKLAQFGSDCLESMTVGSKKADAVVKKAIVIMLTLFVLGTAVALGVNGIESGWDSLTSIFNSSTTAVIDMIPAEIMEEAEAVINATPEGDVPSGQ